MDHQQFLGNAPSAISWKQTISNFLGNGQSAILTVLGNEPLAIEHQKFISNSNIYLLNEASAIYISNKWTISK